MTEKHRKNLEDKNLTPTPYKTHRRWKSIAQELSDLNLSPKDLDFINSEKPGLALQLVKKNNVGLGEMILIRQAYKAIEDGDTRAAEFFRDTMGENPKQIVEVQRSTVSQMTDEEIQNALDKINNMITENNSGGNDDDNNE